jgi:hypothetical protein
MKRTVKKDVSAKENRRQLKIRKPSLFEFASELLG